jgi:hypothetical protein
MEAHHLICGFSGVVQVQESYSQNKLYYHLNCPNQAVFLLSELLELYRIAFKHDGYVDLRPPELIYFQLFIVKQKYPESGRITNYSDTR